MLIASKPLLAKFTLKKLRFSLSPDEVVVTGLNSLWLAISNIMATSLYLFEFGSVMRSFCASLNNKCNLHKGKEKKFSPNVMNAKRLLNEICKTINRYVMETRWCIRSMTVASATSW